jgi:hypothetical protein
MTPQEIRVAIANECGTARPYYMDGVRHIDSPNYPSDLNAMHEAEKVLTKQQIPEYIRNIWDKVAPLCADYANTACFQIKHASADVCAEAFLRTLNLWKD